MAAGSRTKGTKPKYASKPKYVSQCNTRARCRVAKRKACSRNQANEEGLRLRVMVARNVQAWKVCAFCLEEGLSPGHTHFHGTGWIAKLANQTPLRHLWRRTGCPTPFYPCTGTGLYCNVQSIIQVSYKCTIAVYLTVTESHQKIMLR